MIKFPNFNFNKNIKKTTALDMPESPCVPVNPLCSAGLLKVPSLICVFLAGLMVSSFICVGTGTWFAKKTAEIKQEEAVRISKIKPDMDRTFSEENSKIFIETDPFGTRQRATEAGDIQEVPVSLTLEGTLSTVAAYLNGGSDTGLVMKGQDYMGFTLVSVGGGEAVVEKDGKKTILFMELTAGDKKTPSAIIGKNTKNTKNSKNIWNSEQTAQDIKGRIEAASPDSIGSVPRELVDQLLMDPYEEMSKIRMIPGDSGMKIARIADDSILASVGVKKDDVIKAVNGVTISNLGDATNAINSMMSGTRFDVTVEREGSPVELKYEVR